MATVYNDQGNARVAVTDDEMHTKVGSIGKTSAAHNRNIDDAVTTTHPGTDASNTATWTTTESVTELEIRVVETTAGDLQTSDAFLVVINAPTAAIAKAWLEDNTTDYAQDVVYEMGYFGEALNIQRTSPIVRIDVLPISGVNMRFVIGAV